MSTNDSGPHAGNIDVILMDRENGMVISGGDDGGGHVSGDHGVSRGGKWRVDDGLMKKNVAECFSYFSVKCKAPNWWVKPSDLEKRVCISR